MKLISWNIDSVNAALTGKSKRAAMSRQVLSAIKELDPDIIGIQETKLRPEGPSQEQLKILGELLPAYQLSWASSVPPARRGYAGTLFLWKEEIGPKVSKPVIGAPEPMDQEGRILTLELDDLFVSQVYTPNSGNELARLKDRQVWDACFRQYVSGLDQKKPVIIMGDFNCAHEEIDLAHPDRNHESAGFTDEEREGFSQLLQAGFTDSFRWLHGEVEGVYSWWAQRVASSKINNSGWRIDYFLLSDRIRQRLIRSEMVDSGPRQDHTPLLLEIQ